MSVGPLDPRIDLMVAALYGELSVEEWSRFESLLVEDEALRREWEELLGTRRSLASWEVEESPSSFVLVEPRSAAGRAGGGRRWAGRIRTLFTSPAEFGWVVAAAAVLLLTLSWLDLRVERHGNGIALRFGSPESQTADGTSTSPGRHESWVTDSVGTRIPITGDFAGGRGDSPYMTRDEFYAYSEGVARALGDLIQAADYNRTKNEEFSGYMRTLYHGLEDRQTESYYDLRTRIETIRYGLDSREGSFLEDYPSGESISPGGKSGPARNHDDEGEGGR